MQLGGNDLGDGVGPLKMNKKETLDIIGNPFSDSDSAFVYSFEGAIREINLSGVYTTNDGTLTTFINTIEALIDGSQTSAVNLVTSATEVPASTTFSVYIKEWNYTNPKARPNELDYSLKLIEGQ